MPHFKQTYTVYILRCNDGTHYVGRTKNLHARLSRHFRGHVKYTSKRLPVKLVTYTVFLNEYTAVLFEKYLKSGSGRAFAKRRFL